MADKFSEPLCGTVAPHFGEGPVLLVEWIKSPKQQLRQSLEDLGYSVRRTDTIYCLITPVWYLGFRQLPHTLPRSRRA
jgi:hypothetical protein